MNYCRSFFIFLGFLIIGSLSADESAKSDPSALMVWTSPSGLIMQAVSGGSFRMGLSAEEAKNRWPEWIGAPWFKNTIANLACHTATVKPFWIARTEVTQAHYEAVIGRNPSSFRMGSLTDSNPVDSVNWYEAVEFCNRLSILENLRPVYSLDDERDPALWGSCPHLCQSEETWKKAIARWDLIEMNENADGYRLPTESEWEFAARGGSIDAAQVYPGGAVLEDVAWTNANSESRTHGVGQKTANELGLYDLAGNVAEWCWDWCEPYPSQPQVEPRGPSGESLRAARGGSYYNYLDIEFDVVSRGREFPILGNDYNGFRVARSAF